MPTTKPSRWAPIAQAVEAGRRAKGWSKAELIEASGVSEPIVRAITKATERVGTLKPEMLAKVGLALGESADWLVAMRDEIAAAAPPSEPPAEPGRGVNDLLAEILKELIEIHDTIAAAEAGVNAQLVELARKVDSNHQRIDGLEAATRGRR